MGGLPQELVRLPRARGCLGVPQALGQLVAHGHRTLPNNSKFTLAKKVQNALPAIFRDVDRVLKLIIIFYNRI